jgi:hypothetical protein
MNSEEEFKKILNEKLNSKEFPFNADNWENARKMIDVLQAKRKRRLIVFISFLAMLSFIGLYLFLPIDAFNRKTQSNTHLYENTNAQNKTGAESKVAIKSNTNRNKSKETIENQSAEKQSAEKQLASKKSHSVLKQTNEVSETTIVENHGVAKSLAKTPLIKKQISTKKSIHAEKSFDASKDRGVALTFKTRKTNKQTHLPNAEKEASTKGTTKNPKDPNPLNVDETESIVEAGRADLKMSRKKKINNNNNPPSVEVKGFEKQSEDNAETIGEMSKPNTVAKTNTLTNSPEGPIQEDFSAAIKNNLQDTTATKNEVFKMTDSVSDKNVVVPKNIFSVDMGTFYTFGWKNNGTTDAKGFNPAIGLIYTRVLKEKLNLSIALQYFSIGHLNNYTNESSVSKYGFGRENATTRITPVKIHYLSLPLKCIYGLNEKNSIGIGYTFAYLLTVNSKIENYTQRINNTTTSSPTTVTKAKGYAQGFRPIDSQINVFYRRKILNELYAQSEFFLGLTDIKQNFFFGSNFYERNTGLKITLIYNLFKI